VACSLLRGTGRPITEVAEDVGYRSLSSFNRHFQELPPGPQDVAHAVIISASTPQSSRLCMLFSSFIKFCDFII